MLRSLFKLVSVMSLLAASAGLSGCSLLPDVMHQPQFHNPFPQLHRVAILPFYNQSADPHVHQDEIALAYYNELQQIPGFEVMPVGTAKAMLQAYRADPHSPEDFQKLAQLLGVDAVIVGAVTDYSPYYPPRMGLAVNWYAANPGFHPIPAGYGLPWGTAEEEFIPNSLVQQAEFELAREQLKTQTPAIPAEFDARRQLSEGKNPLRNGAPLDSSDVNSPRGVGEPRDVQAMTARQPVPALAPIAQPKLLTANDASPRGSAEPIGTGVGGPVVPNGPNLPPGWPDPRGFVPPPPCPERPAFLPNSAPIITHTKLYDGHDADFTTALSSYYYFRDDARFGGWQSYLQRSDDFIRFCCYMHITETLAARGGAGQTRVVWRWPIGRYER